MILLDIMNRIILEDHDAIINTTGIKNIPDIFKMSSKLKGILTKQAQQYKI